MITWAELSKQIALRRRRSEVFHVVEKGRKVENDEREMKITLGGAQVIPERMKKGKEVEKEDGDGTRDDHGTDLPSPNR